MKFVNLTPHKLNVLTEEGYYIEVPPSGQVARVETEREFLGFLESPEGLQIPLYRTVLKDPVGVPEPDPMTFYIVSAIVKQALPEREDLLAPGELIRDEEGRVIGCRGLSL